jgi:3-hydroxyisobutyrate dehydrogenase
MNIGYVGLGALGSELARRFLPGHALTVWDLHPAAATRFHGTGAHIAESPAELAARCNVILICLPRSADVQQLVFGEEGLAGQLTDGTLIIDQTSGVPAETAVMAEQLRAHGVSMIDAAVSASPQIVPTGGATLMLSGPAEAVERARPVLQVITTNILHCGARVGDGQAMKLVNNAINAAIRLGTLEITALGRKAGCSLQELSDRFNAGPARSITTDRMLPALLRGETSTNFALALMLKDLNQAVEFGMVHGVPVPVASITRSLLQIGLNQIGDGARLEDMVGVIERLAGTRIAGHPVGEAVTQPAALPSLETALTALCHVATLECVTAGRRYGLQLDVMRDVLTRTSGWSAAGRLLLSSLTGAEPADAAMPPAWPAALLETFHLAAQMGSPIQLLGAVQAAVAAANADSGPRAERAA